jgi:S1-C subfamily serine protease
MPFSRLSIIVWMISLPGSAAWAEGLPPEKLDLAKKATARLRVTLADGKISQGSGFFAFDPGVLITNAHVVGMPAPSSPPPQKIEIYLDSGRQVTGTVLGIDLGADLAAIKVEGEKLPTPLKLGDASSLTEKQELFILGYPFGKELGKEITVGKSSVSSLRKNTAGVLTQVQVNGGMHAGNSGGPVLAANGEVAAIAVSGIKATQIQFAIPAGIAASFLNGRVTELAIDLAFKDGDKVKVPYRITLVDPLKRLKEVGIQFWLGAPGPLRSSTLVEPKPLAGDGELKVFPVALNGTTSLSGDIILPPRPDDQAYWFRATYTTGDGKKSWRAGIGFRPNPVSRTPVTLVYKPKPLNYVELTSDAELKLREPSGENHILKMNVHPKFKEQQLGAATPPRFRHTYTDLTLTLNLDNEPMKKTDFQRILAQIRNVTSDVEMAKDGGVDKSTANVSRVPAGGLREDVELIADQILQSLELMALPLPSSEIKPLQTWKAQRVIDIGPSFASVSANVDVRYEYLGVSQQGGKSLAVFELKGPLKTRRGEGVNVRGMLEGTARVDTETGEVTTAKLSVKADMDMKVEKETWTGHGEVAITLKRSETPPVPATPPKK